MGQEYGHAYEDLLELALLQILPKLNQGNKRYRISPIRRLKGVTFDIDHLIEVSTNDSGWQPFVLFMEKHSDSQHNSEFHFRRHLEEYVQAKVSSVKNFGFTPENSLNVINLIYGNHNGWKGTIINESKRLIFPTLNLMGEPYYENLNKLVGNSVTNSPRPYRRDVVRQFLETGIKNNQAFYDFTKQIHQYILIDQKLAPERQKNWIYNEIIRGVEKADFIPSISNYSYIRRTLTELFILCSKQRSLVTEKSKKSNFWSLGSEDGLTPEDFRQFQLAFVGSAIISNLTAYDLNPSLIMTALPQGSWLEKKMLVIEQMFFSNQNFYGISSSDYLAYFDIRDKKFIEIPELACHHTLDLLQGKKESFIQFLMQPCNPCNLASFLDSRVQNRIQNLYLESVMALASCTAKILTDARIDLSTPTLSRYAGVSISTINKSRSSTIKKRDVASKIADGIIAFFHSLEVENFLLIYEFINTEIMKFIDWKNWDGNSFLPEIPNIINPSLTMSLAWFRHNQLNGHNLYNPLFAIIFEWAKSKKEDSYEMYGFPQNTSANPLQLVLGNSYESADYEFLLIFWNSLERKLKIFQSSSVVDFKNTSHKCKELCAKVRIVKALLSSHCESHFWLLIDGDWRGEHMRDLLLAGWDEVVYSRDFIEQLNK